MARSLDKAIDVSQYMVQEGYMGRNGLCPGLDME